MILFIAILTSMSTFFLAFIHIYWAHGGNWPANSRADLINIVYGQGDKFPSILACYIVALLLLVAGIASLLISNIIEVPILIDYDRWIIIGVGIVFGFRGLGGFIPSFEKLFTKEFNYYNKRLYSPLCILLSVLYFLQLC